MQYFVHDQAICESSYIGKDTKIWAFTHILPNAVIGENCNVCDYVFIENDVQIGNHVTLKSGVQLWDGIRIEDHVFIGPNVTFCNDLFPRSKQRPEKFLSTLIKRGASIGANATLLPGITIHENAMVGAGAVVTASVPDNAIVVGNPAKIIGFTTQRQITTAHPTHAAISNTTTPIINQSKLHTMRVMPSSTGQLTFCEFNQEIPFYPQRSFTLYGIPKNKVRGNHAHHECQQFIVCLHGSTKVMTDNGDERQIFLLNKPNLGLYVPAYTWNTLYEFSDQAIVIVYASLHYDPADYIYDYPAFLQLVRNKQEKNHHY